MFEILLVKLINYLDTLPPLILILFAINNKVLRGSVIFYYLIIQFLFNLSANILNELDWPNLYLYHLNCLFSFYALSYFYFKLLNTKKSQKIITWVAVAYTLFFFYNIFLLERVNVFNSNSFGLASFILCGFALYYYLKLFKSPTKENISKSPNFYFNTGIFSYYTINFFIFLTYNKLTEGQDPLVYLVWKVHNIVFFIMCIYFFTGALCKRVWDK